MGRRKTSAFEDLVDLIAMLPWWAGVAAAGVFYLWLHNLASGEIAVATQPGQAGQMVSQALWKGLASGGQYLLPAACLLGAGLSAMGRYRRRKLVSDVASEITSAGVLDGMTWREFEMLVGEAFRQRGFAVIETGGGGADGGVDLVLSRQGERFLVQCKQWKAYKVGVSVVRELYGVMAARGAVGGYVVTSGQFTEEAKGFADGRNIVLMNGAALRALIRDVRPAAEIALNDREPRIATDQRPVMGPPCPDCGAPMARRTAKRGSNAGKSFLGCSRYPACRGIRDI